MYPLCLGVVPGFDSLIVARLSDTHVIEGGGVCNYYYTLNLMQGGPSRIPEDLMTLVTDVVPPHVVKYEIGDLHCTMYLSTLCTSPGPDLTYSHHLSKLIEKP